jgi:cytochrome P450
VSDVSTLPPVPKNPLSIRQLLRAVRNLDAGQEVLRAAGGTVTRIQVGPKWLFPPVVAVFSPSGIRDVLGRNDAAAERCVVHDEVRHLGGDSLFVLPNEPWLPRKRALQPVFTKPTSAPSVATCHRPRRHFAKVGPRQAKSISTSTAAGSPCGRWAVRCSAST